jgi:hypothetical protein
VTKVTEAAMAARMVVFMFAVLVLVSVSVVNGLMKKSQGL